MPSGDPRNNGPLPPGLSVVQPKDCFEGPSRRGLTVPLLPAAPMGGRTEVLAGGRSGIRKREEATVERGLAGGRQDGAAYLNCHPELGVQNIPTVKVILIYYSGS